MYHALIQVTDRTDHLETLIGRIMSLKRQHGCHKPTVDLVDIQHILTQMKIKPFRLHTFIMIEPHFVYFLGGQV